MDNGTCGARPGGSVQATLNAQRTTKYTKDVTGIGGTSGIITDRYCGTTCTTTLRAWRSKCHRGYSGDEATACLTLNGFPAKNSSDGLRQDASKPGKGIGRSSVDSRHRE